MNDIFPFLISQFEWGREGTNIKQTEDRGYHGVKFDYFVSLCTIAPLTQSYTPIPRS